MGGGGRPDPCPAVLSPRPTKEINKKQRNKQRQDQKRKKGEQQAKEVGSGRCLMQRQAAKTAFSFAVLPQPGLAADG